ncbi:hypothetical protein evm_012866 [Chilo suppressalis]|nr:hypothetical protein evm_012866 [Chilo suppressalis]
MDGIGDWAVTTTRPSADWWVLTTADAAGTNGLTCLPKHGGARDSKFLVTHPMTDHCESCLTSTNAAERANHLRHRAPPKEDLLKSHFIALCLILMSRSINEIASILSHPDIVKIYNISAKCISTPSVEGTFF